MGIHVTRTKKGVLVRYYVHAGERVTRLALRIAGGAAKSRIPKAGTKQGASAGTSGDFGEDFE